MSTEPPVETIAGRRVLFAMAASPEFGPELKRRFTPVMVGVGPVEAAVHAAAALAHLSGLGRPADLVVSLGSAGSRRLRETEVYQAASVSYRDMDASLLGFARGETPFLDLPAAVAVPFRIPGVPAATLSTGARIVSGSDYDGIDADMVDMESFAVLRAAMQNGCAFIGLRGISDGSAPLSGVEDWTRFLHLIDVNLAAAVDQLGAGLVSGAIAL
ncbi:MAG TPA: 5'-methylthioadenosine/S-adenosylhomocysteine nucleosidase [Aestuariivirgaceae bacterium]|nr:5'-methylthioadenosine/S-adenosylhomocysteine nucleosidase [Aestuariivirgaceae bacterium]